nr:AAA family ATPase [Sediminibacillus massiliensis]
MEVEALRFIDQVQHHDASFAEMEIAQLYSIVAFYRLMRNFDDDQIVEKLLREAEAVGVQSKVLTELNDVRQLLQLYTDLDKIDLKNWAMRETDFDPAKLKKTQDLLAKIKVFLYEKGYNSEDFLRQNVLSGAEEIKQELIEKLVDLSGMLEETVFAIENKKKTIPVTSLNREVKDIYQLGIDLYESFPTAFKKTAKQDPLKTLDEMIGLEDVKRYINQYYHYLKYQKERRELGFNIMDEPGLHMVISGNPGTGKTTIARLLSAIYHELGLLETDQVTEVNRSNLVGSYVGQSEENTIGYVRQSVGGILFIDEAYSLKREGQTGNDYGQAVIDTLVSSMTSKELADKFAVILAGYPEEMRQFLWSNPGLRSRFPEQNHIHLPDFRTSELLQIAEKTALDNDYFFTKEALNKFEDLIEQSRVDETFGNARTVRDLVLKAIFHKGAYKSRGTEENWLDHMRIEAGDLHFADKGNQSEDPIKQLDDLIGLGNVKEEVKKLSSFVQVQQQRKQNGLPNIPVQMHAVFSGNPGTGKTTVANIYSQILNHCGLLKRGHLVVASRSDLVAGYVGQTAIKTKQKVREALGGVLFIDEAYSLYRGDKDFGKEAIDTLVDEMTKHNENLVVILAGYEQEMERFIESNPGLESRFKKYFLFRDYLPEELVEITKFHLSKYQYEAGNSAIEYLQENFMKQTIEGNARFIVNLVDEAIQFQALRMMNGQPADLLDQQLIKQDFQQAWDTVRGKKS